MVFIYSTNMVRMSEFTVVYITWYASCILFIFLQSSTDFRLWLGNVDLS
jgi:hypothetical protein